jgi:hypothetical protein
MRLRGDRAAHEMAESYAHDAGLPIAARGTLQRRYTLVANAITCS